MEEVKPYIPSFSIIVIHNGVEISQGTFQRSKVKIGRGSNCDICLDKFAYISRHHLTVLLKKESLKVIDEDSRLGTYYFGEKISSVEIESRGVFEISDISIQVTFNPVQESHDFDKVGINVLEKTVTHLMETRFNANDLKKNEDSQLSNEEGSQGWRESEIINKVFRDSHFIKNQFFKESYDFQETSKSSFVSPSLRSQFGLGGAGLKFLFIS